MDESRHGIEEVLRAEQFPTLVLDVAAHVLRCVSHFGNQLFSSVDNRNDVFEVMTAEMVTAPRPRKASSFVAMK